MIMKKKNFLITMAYLVFIGFALSNNAYSQKKKMDDSVISEITNHDTALDKKDVINYFCLNLTEYFNTYKYYKISCEIYDDAAKQTEYPISRITKDASLYKLQYFGAGGSYTVTFGKRDFSDAEQIFSFGRRTIAGNAIRNKVYDTFVSWLKRTEISLKANHKLDLYYDDLHNAVELENWYNDLNGNK
jgi:hypothetical protein